MQGRTVVPRMAGDEYVVYVIGKLSPHGEKYFLSDKFDSFFRENFKSMLTYVSIRAIILLKGEETI